MKCQTCGVEYSDKVYKIHKKICKGKEVETVENEAEVVLEEETETLTLEQLREIAKEHEVPSYWVKGEETLIKELKELEVI